MISSKARWVGVVLGAVVAALLCTGCGSSGITTTAHGQDVATSKSAVVANKTVTTPRSSTGGSKNGTGTPTTLQGAQLCKDFTLAQAQSLEPKVEGPAKVASSAQTGAGAKAFETAECNYYSAVNGSTVAIGISFGQKFNEAEWVQETQHPAAGGQEVTTGITDLGEGAACVRQTGASGNTAVYIARGTAQVKLLAESGNSGPASCAAAVATARVVNEAIT